MNLLETVLGTLAGHALLAQVDKHNMVIRTAGDNVKPVLDEAACQRFRVQHDLVLVRLKLRLQRLAEADSLRCNDVAERSALDARKDRLVDGLHDILAVAEDHTAARSAQGFVGRGRDNVRILERIRMLAGRNKARNVSHIDHEHRTDLVRDLAERFKIDGSGISRSTGHDHLRHLALCDLTHFIVIDAARIFTHAVSDRGEILT